jgi:acyl-CoA thioester hydrolase
MLQNKFLSKYRVYYEDTDAGGIVYYANYLKFAERARTDWLRELGINQIKILQNQNITLVVKRVEVDFLTSARLDDEILVETYLQEANKVIIKMLQIIKKDGITLANLFVVITATKNGKAVRIPKEIYDVITKE